MALVTFQGIQQRSPVAVASCEDANPFQLIAGPVLRGDQVLDLSPFARWHEVRSIVTGLSGAALTKAPPSSAAMTTMGKKRLGISRSWRIPSPFLKDAWSLPVA